MNADSKVQHHLRHFLFNNTFWCSEVTSSKWTHFFHPRGTSKMIVRNSSETSKLLGLSHVNRQQWRLSTLQLDNGIKGGFYNSFHYKANSSNFNWFWDFENWRKSNKNCSRWWNRPTPRSLICSPTSTSWMRWSKSDKLEVLGRF